MKIEYDTATYAQCYCLVIASSYINFFFMQRYQQADSRSGLRTGVGAKGGKASVEAEIKRTMKASKIQRDVVCGH